MSIVRLSYDGSFCSMKVIDDFVAREGPFWATTLVACRRNSCPGRVSSRGCAGEACGSGHPGDLCEPGSEENGNDRWTAELKRKDFGITPISLRQHRQGEK